MVLMGMDWLANSETRGTLSQCISELGDSDGFSYKALLPVVNSQGLRCVGAGSIRYELLVMCLLPSEEQLMRTKQTEPR